VRVVQDQQMLLFRQFVEEVVQIREIHFVVILGLHEDEVILLSLKFSGIKISAICGSAAISFIYSLPLCNMIVHKISPFDFFPLAIF
jgi:hypothetical protein